MNTNYNPAALSKLRIWQQNTRKSQVAHQHTLNTDPFLFNLILIQEPWIHSFSNARGSHNWQVIYPSNRYNDNHNTICSIILVNTNISTDSYISLHIPHSDITVLCLKGDFGHCAIFNIYNDCTNNESTDALKAYLMTDLPTAQPLSNNHMFWFGDFNCHHPLWRSNANRCLFSSSSLVNLLIDLVSNYDMTLALPAETPTYKTATGNWTRLNNVWCSNNLEDPIVSCNVDASICPPYADHLPIITELDLTIPHASSFPTHNMRDTNLEVINMRLKEHLALWCPIGIIHHKEDVKDIVNTLVNTINKVIVEEVPILCPTPYIKCWWTKELTDLKKEKNWLSNLSYKLHGMPDAPVHAKHKETVNIFCNRLEEIKKVHWTDWLEEALSKDIYTTNKYITSEPSNYLNARIPSLKTKDPNGHDILVSENTAKAKALADTFFPPPPDTPIIPAMAYPESLKAKGIFTRDNICRAIKNSNCTKHQVLIQSKT